MRSLDLILDVRSIWVVIPSGMLRNIWDYIRGVDGQDGINYHTKLSLCGLTLLPGLRPSSLLRLSVVGIGLPLALAAIFSRRIQLFQLCANPNPSMAESSSTCF